MTTHTTTRSGTSGKTKQRTVQTTTLEIERPADFARLESRFRVERYVLPDDLRYSTSTTSHARRIVFARIHTALRDQLDCAYKVFTHDGLDGHERWAVYALFLRDVPPVPLALPWHRHPGPLPHRAVTFAEVPFHITLKLLQLALFRGGTSTRFVGQDHCYTYACPDGRDFASCVRIELKGARDAKETDRIHAFRVIGHATRFGPADLAKARPWDALFGKRAVGSRFYFLHLKTGQAEQEPAVYHEVHLADQRAHVKYHDPRDLDAGRGKILYDFIQEYLAYLRDLGITGAPRRRTLTAFAASDGQRLDISRLGPIGVYDNRLARDAHPLSAYVGLFARLRPDVAFVPLQQMADVSQGGSVLVLLDAVAADFAADGVLARQVDPYQLLYCSTPQIPKQSLVVNGNDPSALAGGDYLDYPFPGPDDEDQLTLRLETVLNELYLKSAISYGYEQVPLPGVPCERGFIRKSRYEGEIATTALWYRGGHLSFADLGDPSARDAFGALLAQWGVNYTARMEEFQASLGRADEPPAYDIIVGPDLFVVIEDLQERVLYAYDEIVRRRRAWTEPRPATDFQLAPHYDALKTDDMLPLASLLRAAAGEEVLHERASGRGGGGRGSGQAAALVRSRAFYDQLLTFDQLLADIAITHPSLSLAELTGGSWRDDIARIFGGMRDTAKPSRRILLAKYRKLNRFLSDRGNDVQLSQGIWHDVSGAFIVGATTPMHATGQQNAHVMRCFRVLQGAEHFHPEEFLAAMAVQYVRPRQYTVVPYHYHLIDLYVENVRRYEMAVR